MSATLESAPGTPTNAAPPTSASALASSSGGATTTANVKRSLFGRKKKSTSNLGASASTGTLTSGNSSLKGRESAESFDKTGGAAGGTASKKSIFKRRNKNDSSGAVGSIDENGDIEIEKNGGERNSDDDNSSIMTYDSESDPMPDPQSDPLSATSPSHPAPGNPQSSSAISPLSNTSTVTAITSGNSKGKNGGNSLPVNSPIVGKKSSTDLLKGAFTRRSTSPISPTANGSSGKPGGAVGNLFNTSGSKDNSNKENSDPANIRPSTAGGALDSRRSQERGRRTGRTSDDSNVPPVPAVRMNQTSADDHRKPSNGKAWPAGIVTRDFAQPPSTPQKNSAATADDGAPKTTVTPPTPTDSAGHFSSKSPVGAVIAGGGASRRSRSGSLGNTPSKLSQSTTMPVTPSNEDIPPGEVPTANNWNAPGAGSFFQSMFSAAQNAATTLSTSIANTNLINSPGNRSRSGTGNSDRPEAEKENEGAVTSGVEEKKEPPKRLAVETLGQGELSLGSLGIVPSPIKQSPGSTESSTTRSRSGSLKGRSTNGEVGHQLKSTISDGSLRDRYERQPLSATSGYETGGENLLGNGGFEGQRPAKTPVVEDSPFIGSQIGNRAGSATGDVTPERASLDDRDDWDGEGKRSGSVQSGEKKRRKRGTSGASNGNPQPVPKPTGFAVASKKRNRDFHSLFRSVPEDDYLIEDYGCALQKEILLQGRLYVSEGHICFNSNIFGWINTLVISFDEVVSVEKKSTAMVFPNAIVIQTLHARHVFASFISRDSTFELIVSIWKIGHPQLVDGGGIARLENAGEGVAEANGDVGSEVEEEIEDEEYEDDSDADLGESNTDTGDVSFGDDGGKDEAGPVSKAPSRKPSQALGATAAGGGEGKESVVTAGVDFPGPHNHAPTSCGDESEHYDKSLCDEVIQAPLGKVYSILFGANSYPFMSKFLADDQKVLDLVIPDKGEWTDANGKKARSYSYIKPLSNGIGPKQTKCNITETIEVNDMEDHVTVVMTIQTPDVPSGNVFVVKSRYCLMWAEDGATRMIVNCTVEWSGKSWLKGPIEKGANDGQVAFNKDLLVALRKELQPKEAKQAKGKKGKRKRDRDTKGEAIGKTAGGKQKGKEAQDAGPASSADNESWGVFAPLKTYLGPIVDILQPLFQGNLAVILICVLFVLILINQTRGGTNSSKDVQYRSAPVGRAHWEDVWRSEEDSLWEWLEDRAGLYAMEVSRDRRMKSFERVLGGKPLTEGMKEREVQEAIGIMEERLAVLKKIVEERKYKPGKESSDSDKVEL